MILLMILALARSLRYTAAHFSVVLMESSWARDQAQFSALASRSYHRLSDTHVHKYRLNRYFRKDDADKP